jgi:hypothetical protein
MQFSENTKLNLILSRNPIMVETRVFDQHPFYSNLVPGFEIVVELDQGLDFSQHF